MRGPLIVVEIVALGAILAFVEDTLVRIALGLVVGVLLARAALVGGRAEELEGPPSGLDDRRQDHLFRHWVNVLLKKVREFHTVCQGVATGGVNMAVGQLRIHEIEKEIQELLSQVTESAKPEDMKKRGRRKGTTPRPRGPAES
ncbi:MAG: hypothetical protein GWN99_19210 [Gemmatimonadetes bacterium]|uniref:Uncharacterized protein n=1 Tax=Candidatus Kutchimonas denitrificans TaxID=3056748 RepID=A0AAE4ZAG6_9BACT|nr:hypothetical protein [Gemmatimonadota bacterium]NIR73795.1 hypothetical protein [Candidatus Kutchimonas denitrificans]NIS03159.1 hypothetical protein [Gemmatimonadota bacterium]NIT69060.1 hypothetical protein [Gemmatimonadota bacterium]NIU54151.1 hypothetical protein [Gemmatimonadota bacterium]